MTQVQSALGSLAPNNRSALMLRLYQLADSQCGVYSYETGRLQPLKDDMHSPALYRLAVDFTLRSLHLDKDLLKVFCEPDAAALLMRLPNRYWFWSAIRTAILQIGDDGLDTLLTLEHVSHSLAELRRNVACKYNLRRPMTELSPPQIASRALAGVILVKSSFMGDHDEILFNPIFAPCPGTDGTFAESAAALTAALLKD